MLENQMLNDKDVKQVSYESYIVYNATGLKKALENYVVEFRDDDKKTMLSNIKDEPENYPCLITLDTPNYPYNRILVKSISIEELQKYL